MRIPLAIVGIVLLSVFYHVGTTAEPLVTCTIRRTACPRTWERPERFGQTDQSHGPRDRPGRQPGRNPRKNGVTPIAISRSSDQTGGPQSGRCRRCGNMNALRKEEFVSVPPGGAFDPYQHNDHFGFFRSYYLSARSFPIVGEYRIRFCYSTDEMHPGYWFGDLGRNPPLGEVEQLLSRVPKVSIASDWISVRVTRQAE